MTNLEIALKYLSWGWSVIPLGTDKRPPIIDEDKQTRFSWKKYQTQLPTEKEIRSWFNKWPNCQLGIALGPVSKLVVVDVDGRKGGYESLKNFPPMPDTATVKTNDGEHFYFLHPDCEITKYDQGGIERRAHGHYVVAPPSIHPSGTVYRWAREPEECGVLPLPEWIAELKEASKTQPKPDHASHRVDIPANATHARKYVLSALNGEVRKLEGATNGTRHQQRMNSAIALGGFIPSGAIDASEIEEALSVNFGDDKQNAVKTIRDGIKMGEKRPRTIPQPNFESTPKPIAKIKDADEVDVNELAEQEGIEHLTEWGNAIRLVSHFGSQIRYCHAWGKWLVWNGDRWKVDSSGQISRFAKETTRRIYAEAAQVESKKLRLEISKWAHKSEELRKINAMIAHATNELGIPVEPDELDGDPWQFNVLNGTIDLKSGLAFPHEQNDCITCLAPVEYRPGAECPMWEKFLSRVLPDEDTRAFVKRAVGYSLTGDVSAQVMFFLYGVGKNGKSTFTEVLSSLLGDYWGKTRAETLMYSAQKNAGPTPEVAALKGKRFITVSEVGEGQRLNEALIKDLTGKDAIQARHNYQDPFNFHPTFKVWMYGNHKPTIRSTDEGIWRRPKLIPFTAQITEDERDEHLQEKLHSELSGILNWALEGCLEWQKSGLGDPKQVREATQEYRIEMDILQGFLDEYCDIDPAPQLGYGISDTAKNLYDAYVAWSEEVGERPKTKTKFGLTLTERGFIKEKVGTVKWWGIQVKTECQPKPKTEYRGGFMPD